MLPPESDQPHAGSPESLVPQGFPLAEGRYDVMVVDAAWDDAAAPSVLVLEVTFTAGAYKGEVLEVPVPVAGAAFAAARKIFSLGDLEPGDPSIEFAVLATPFTLVVAAGDGASTQIALAP